MKKSKRLLALLLAGVMVASFAACGDDKDKDKDSSGGSSGDASDDSGFDKDPLKDGDIELNKPGEFPIVKEGQDPVHLSIFTSPQADTSTEFGRDINPVTKYIEDKLNLRFDWEVVSKADKTAKLNLLFTVDDYADIVFGSYWDGAAQLEYGSKGYLLPIDPYIDNGEGFYQDKYIKMGQDIKEDTVSDLILDSMIMPDGHQYSFYNYQSAVHMRAPYRMYCYTPWLDAVGMEMPTTTDEFYDVLKAFKEKDPNGNGKADEIPLAGSLKGWNTNPTDYLMNSFLYHTGPSRRYIYRDGDEVVYGPTTDAFRDGLEYMAMLTEEGLFLKDTWTLDANGLKALTTEGSNTVGFAPGGSVTAVTGSAVNRKEGEWTGWQTIAPLEGPDGIRFCEYVPPYPGAQFSITDNCEYPRIAFRFGDALYEGEIAKSAKNGMQDEYWRYAEEGEVGLDGKPAEIVLIQNAMQNSADGATNVCWGQMSHAPDLPGWHTAMAVLGDPKLEIEALLYNSGVQYLEYSPGDDMVVPTLIFDKDVSKDVVTYRAETDNVVYESIARFVTEGVTDASWDAYIADLNSRGLEDLMKIYQDTYDGMYK